MSDASVACGAFSQSVSVADAACGQIQGAGTNPCHKNTELYQRPVPGLVQTTDIRPSEVALKKILRRGDEGE
jgi:hypothetical protein